MSEDEPARAFELAAADFAALAPRLWDPLGRILWCSTRRRAPASGSWTPAAVPAHRPSPPRRRWGPRAGSTLWTWPARCWSMAAGPAGIGRNLRFTRADVTAWRPAADGPYDLVQSGYGVFFLPDMDAGGEHLVSLLRPGGRFAVQALAPGCARRVRAVAV
jgi:hypothetical protein